MLKNCLTHLAENDDHVQNKSYLGQLNWFVGIFDDDEIDKKYLNHHPYDKNSGHLSSVVVDQKL